MYRIIDGQGGGLMAMREFKTLDEARDTLRSFHSIDTEGVDKMSLAQLCELGVWTIEENGKELTL